MAYNLRQINVLDRRPSTGIGVALPFSNPRGVFTTVYNTAEQLRYNLINFLLTNNRERIFNPTFGANIRSKLFEQITETTLDELDTLIRTGVETYFPNVVITNLTFGGDPNKNELLVQFSYTVNSTGASDTVLISLT